MLDFFGQQRQVVQDHGAAGEGGRVTITYKNLEQLDDLLGRLSGG